MYKLRQPGTHTHTMNTVLLLVHAFIHLFNSIRDIQSDPSENIKKIVSEFSSRRNSHFLCFVIFTTFCENNVFAVEDLENTEKNHKEGSKMPVICLPRNIHGRNIYPFPFCRFGEYV
jgi:hypothetical protein